MTEILREQFIAYFQWFTNVFQRNKKMSFKFSKSYEGEMTVTLMTMIIRDVSRTPAASKMELFVTLVNG